MPKHEREWEEEFVVICENRKIPINTRIILARFIRTKLILAYQQGVGDTKVKCAEELLSSETEDGYIDVGKLVLKWRKEKK